MMRLKKYLICKISKGGQLEKVPSIRVDDGFLDIGSYEDDEYDELYFEQAKYASEWLETTLGTIAMLPEYEAQSLHNNSNENHANQQQVVVMETDSIGSSNNTNSDSSSGDSSSTEHATTAQKTTTQQNVTATQTTSSQQQIKHDIQIVKESTRSKRDIASAISRTFKRGSLRKRNQPT